MMVKNKQKLRMTTQELEEYKRNKEKYENLMLYSKTEILGISGKYNKRLYTLLIQFKDKGKFFMNYDIFKEVMEIPNSYKQGTIDERVLNPALEELKKANIFINKIEKNKKGGRSIKVIEIYFTYKEEERKTKKLEINPINSVKSIAESFGMTVEERNDIGLEQVRKIREKMKK
ncbi:MAG: replication initiation protein [Arcobacter sp.]|nr:replication initiation protein [Arcobacter sp.]